MAEQYDYGMIGLGTMGRNLVYNMCDHGYSVAGFDKDSKQRDNLEKEKGNYKIYAAPTVKDFIGSLKQPRVIILLVPAGPIVDAVIDELKPLLSKDDLIMDCGNSHFTDTNARLDKLLKENIHFMGVGVSGGESGARFGPGAMPGGFKDAYERVAPMLKAVSAKVKEEPCVTYLGPGSSGHYVKMVHNGIEYGLMQLIAETYHLMKESLGLNNDELHDVFAKWNEGLLQSFLISITANIFKQPDDLTKNRLVDMILDTAHQKGTGCWTSEDAMSLQVPLTAIDTAVSMRDLSSLKADRQTASKLLKGPESKLSGDKKQLIDTLERSLSFAMMITYAQGMALLHSASDKYKYELKLNEIAAIWRGGCIIRASLLEDIRTAFAVSLTLSNLLLSDAYAKKLNEVHTDARTVAKAAVDAGVPMPALMASLSYYDSFRREWLPANLLQAQRDYFGAHTYERTDKPGTFHTHWNQKEN